MHLTPREIDKLMIHTLAEVALRRKAKGIKLNHPEAVAVISAAALDGAREGKTVEEVMKDAQAALSRADVMDGLADMIPFVQRERFWAPSGPQPPPGPPPPGARSLRFRGAREAPR